MRWGLIILSVTVAVIAAYLAFLAWFIVRLAGEQRAHIAWELRLGGMRDLVPDILPDGTLCCGAGEQLNWVNPDGTLKASYTCAGLGEGVAWYAGAGGLWFVAPQLPSGQSGGGGARLLALTERAEVAWETPLPQGAYANWVCFSDDQVYCALDTGYIVALDLKGNVLWTQQVAQPQPQSAPGYRVQSQINGMGASPNGDVYFTNDRAELVMLDRTGQQRWKTALGGTNEHRPTLAPDGTLLVLDSVSGLHALGADGKLKWSYQPVPPRTSASSLGAPYFGPYGGRYGSALGNGFYAAVSADGTAYFCDWDNQLYAVSVDGKLKWQRDIGGECTAPAVGRDGTIYVAVAGRGVIAYSPEGKRKWRCRGLTGIQSAPILGPSGQLYVETADTLVALEP